ncbi:MAG: type I-F CRISPR-associated endoribonuclease Cas6/Csy4 [Acinetobacter sp.]|nr:type I-F CRISPR-associated endoribonuclease Cas6/Csy4 [Acinetobacter sp.]
MKYYQELTLIPRDGMTIYTLWSKIYNQLHIALANVANTYAIKNIGVSFPHYRCMERDGEAFAMIGDKLRIFAQHRDDLAKLNIEQWLERLLDSVHISSVNEVGNKATGYVVVERYRKPNMKEQARRFAAFKEIAFKDALEHCFKYKRRVQYPFITMYSHTNKKPYQLCIHQTHVEQAVSGEFTVYGINNSGGNLNEKATVPHW